MFVCSIVMILFVLGWKHSVNPIIYPTLGETYALSGEWHLADADPSYSGERTSLMHYRLPISQMASLHLLVSKDV